MTSRHFSFTGFEFNFLDENGRLYRASPSTEPLNTDTPIEVLGASAIAWHLRNPRIEFYHPGEEDWLGERYMEEGRPEEIRRFLARTADEIERPQI